MNIHPSLNAVLKAQQRKQLEECRKINKRMRYERDQANKGVGQSQIQVCASGKNGLGQDLCQGSQAD
jgi:hypothetical protein